MEPNKIIQFKTKKRIYSHYRITYSPAVFIFSVTSALQQPCKVTAPFPHIFTPQVSSEGFLYPTLDTPRKQQPVKSTSVMTSLQSSPSSRDLLEQLHRESAKLNIKKFHHFLDSGLEIDDFSETLSEIASLAANYSSSVGNMV